MIVPAWAAVYTDTVDHWSEQSVLKMDAKGLIKGDGKGNFYPERSVSRQEVIALLVRLIDKENDVLTVNLEESSVKESAKGVGDWAVGYLEVAKKEGIITDNELTVLMWNWEAERQEVAQWLCKAVKQSPQKTDTNGVLEQFVDVYDINKLKSPYIIPLVRDKIIVGSNGYFRPLDSVKRGEVAILLDRSDKKYLDKTIVRSKKGQIIGLDNIDDDETTVKDDKGLVYDLTFAYNTIMYKGGEKVEPEDLALGDWVEYVEDDKDNITYAEVLENEALPEPTTNVVTGSVNSVINAAVPQITIIDSKGNLGIYSMGPDTVFNLNGKLVNFMSIQPGQAVTLELVNGTVSKVYAISVGTTIKGLVTQIDLSSGSLEIKTIISTLNFWLSPNLLTQLKIDTNQVAIGDYVRVKVNNGLVSELFVEAGGSIDTDDSSNMDSSSDTDNSSTDSSNTDNNEHNYTVYTATLDDVDKSKDEVDLKSSTIEYLDDGRWRSKSGSLTLEAADDVEIYYDGDEKDFDDLDDYEDDTIYLVYDEDEDEVIKIRVRKGTEYKYDDTITDMSTRSDWFELDDESKTFYYDESTIVMIDGELMNGDDLMEDDEVYVTVDKVSTKYHAAVVEVTASNTSEGDYKVYKATLDDVDTSNKEIELKSTTVQYLDDAKWRSSSGNLTLEVADSAKMYFDGALIDLNELETYENATIYVVYDEDVEEVIKIKVKKGTEYKYDDEISDQSTRNNRFELNDADKTIYYEDDVIVMIDGKLMNGDDLEEDDKVYVTVDKVGTEYRASVVQVKPNDSSEADYIIYKATLYDVDTRNDEIDLKSNTVQYLDDARWRNKSGSLTLEIASDVEMFFDGNEIDFDELDDYENDTIYVIYNEDEEEVVKLRVKRGITYFYDDEINDSSTSSNWFELDDANKTIYYDDDAIIIKDGELIEGDDLEEDDEVYVTTDKVGTKYHAAVVEVE